MCHSVLELLKLPYYTTWVGQFDESLKLVHAISLFFHSVSRCSYYNRSMYVRWDLSKRMQRNLKLIEMDEPFHFTQGTHTFTIGEGNHWLYHSSGFEANVNTGAVCWHERENFSQTQINCSPKYGPILIVCHTVVLLVSLTSSTYEEIHENSKFTWL